MAIDTGAESASALEKQPADGPLTGVRVIAVEHFVAGPYASMWMADHGAQVIKIETPQSGDGARMVGPFGSQNGEERSLGLVRSNRNKQSISLNLKTPEGAEIFERLLAVSDVLLENLRPKAMERLGFGWGRLQEINPRLIYTTISGFGHDDLLPGPFSPWPAFDSIVQGITGLMFRPERENPAPVYLGFPLTDIFAGSLAFGGTMMALHRRATTGRGQRIDIAMYDGAVALNELAIATTERAGHPAAGGCAFPGLSVRLVSRVRRIPRDRRARRAYLGALLRRDRPPRAP